MEQLSIANLDEFRDLLESLRHDQCLAYGVAPGHVMNLVTRFAWLRAGRPTGQIARTKECFSWPNGPGVLMLDYDPPEGGLSMSSEKLVAAVRAVCPELGGAAMLWWPSASSCIWNAETGVELRGLHGQRLYLLVKDARDIPRAGAALCEHLAAAGHASCLVSTSGTLLDRSLFDTSVWQTNRIDFAAGAYCEPPLEQRRGRPVLIEGSVEFVDTHVAIPEPDQATRIAAGTFRARARAEEAGEAARVRAVWREARVGELVDRGIAAGRGIAADLRPAAEADVDRALDRQELSGDWPLVVVGHEDHRVNVTVGEVLSDPHRWNGLLTLDPIEPEYDGGRVVGKLFLVGAWSNLFSFAHGGRTFHLVASLHRVELVRGRQKDAVDATLEVMRQSTQMFDHGTEVVAPTGGGKLARLDRDSMPYWLGSEIQFYKWSARGKKVVEELADPPPQLCATILALREQRGLKRLDAVVNAPLMRPDGSLLIQPGYDPDTRLLLDLSEPAQPVPEQPTADQLEAAFRRLWEPFTDFPFVTLTDRAVHLAAVLTAVQRPIVNTAPAFVYDAPRQGTGKTKLAECVSVVATGERPTVWPHVADNEEETRKRLFTVFRNGARTLLWDNVTGTFDSATLAGMLTSGVYADRVLGGSISESYPNRLLVLLTGNNISIAGELPRRVLIARLDARSEQPFTRTFTFDPVAMCMTYRPRLVSAALTLMRGYGAAGSPRMHEVSLGSFDEWDRMIRQCVLWLAKYVAPEGLLGDPLDSILERVESDPADEALGALMKAWLQIFGTKYVTAGEILAQYRRFESASETATGVGFREALDEFRSKRELSSRSIGRILSFRRERPVVGLRIERGPRQGDGSVLWRVRDLERPKPGLTGFAGFVSPPGENEEHSSIRIDRTDGPKETRQTQPNPAATVDPREKHEFD